LYKELERDILSSDDAVQTIIKEAKDILTKQTVDDFAKFLEEKSIEFEKEDQFLESAILWHYFGETMENFGEEDYLAYAYSKLISRYLLLEDLKKAEEIYKKAIDKELSSFHLDTVKVIYERRTETKSKKEIVEIARKDIFGDYAPTVTSPTVFFENNTQIRNYIINELPEGTFSIKIFNHKAESIEEIQMTNETLEEYEVISVHEVVRIE
jgi:tetratricopeptide (TPR) repeat protein